MLVIITIGIVQIGFSNSGGDAEMKQIKPKKIESSLLLRTKPELCFFKIMFVQLNFIFTTFNEVLGGLIYIKCNRRKN